MTEYVQKSVTVKDYQAEWLEREDQSPSKILQWAIDERMKDYGFNVEQWKSTYGE